MIPFEHDAPTGTTGATGATGATGHPYGEVLGALEMLERTRRGLDADRLLLIGAALDQVLESSGASGGRSTGARGTRGVHGLNGARELAYRSLRAELATALGESEYRVEQQMNLAAQLSRCYPTVFAALDRGEISIEHSRVIAEAGTAIGGGDGTESGRRRDGYARQALAVAVRETPNRLRPEARRLAEAWAENDTAERHREARERRRVTVADHPDGMADLIAHLPAIEAHAIYDRLTRVARACERGERLVPETCCDSTRDGDGAGIDNGGGIDSTDAGIDSTDAGIDSTDAGIDGGARGRSRDQLRADVLADMLLASDEHRLFAGDTSEAIKARVQLIVPVTAVPGATGVSGTTGVTITTAVTGTTAPTAPEPVCELSGYGPIDSGTARGIAAAASAWSRAGVDASTGVVIGVDRYRPSEQLRRLLGARDRRCRFPGCRVPAGRCDLDHTVDAARGGPTSSENLAHLCRGHHTLKHHSEWRVEQEPAGVMRWTSPAGREHVDRPPGASIPRFTLPLEPPSPEPPSPKAAAPPGAPPVRLGSARERPARSPVLRRVRSVRFEPADEPELVF
ncbi:HNH endonuclease signature motif containing protein [Leucobacter ruminantium]|uniref:DUF222 domain-containing protein n=1 Tax=Leucobacter ruminantium TaxID=1289170 RepID=A0A939LXK8_9MICO|nr:HNH endonuclease signature motif containing protein [Leucobacter ruminantium]MBO1804793.1 DUF222 domain-containing protein [Leucobacter ruminantium]